MLLVYGSWPIYERTSNLLARTRGLQATDQRDKIFGILALHGDRDENLYSLLAPDYNKALSSVMRDAVRYCVMEAKPDTLYLLGLITHRDESYLQYTGLPSWVPRFDRKTNRLVRITYMKHFSRCCYDW